MSNNSALIGTVDNPPLLTKYKSAALSTLIIGLVLSSLFTWFVYHQNQHTLETHFEELVTETERLVKNRFELYEHGLHGAKAVILGGGVQKPNRAVFELYMSERDLRSDFPGARGFGYIHRVPMQNVDEFIEIARSDGWPTFTVKSIRPHYGDKFVIQYIYPLEDNQEAIGLDIASEDNRRNAAIKAAHEGLPTLTEPITLVQERGNVRQGFLVILPVYDTALPIQSPEMRYRALTGWTYAPLAVDEVLADLGLLQKGVKFSLTDEAETTPFFENTLRKTPSNLYSVSITQDIQLMGREWKIEAHSLPLMVNSLGLWSPVWIAFWCVVLSVILSVAVGYWFRNKENRETLDYTSPSVWAFIQSGTVNKLTKVYLFVAALFLIIVTFQQFPEQLQERIESLTNQALRSQIVMQRLSQEYKQDLLFLASTSPIDDMINTIDEVDKKTELKYWQLRLTDIFKAYVISSPDVYQVRFIRANPNSVELVRVQRKDQNVHVVSDANLQFKGDRPYVAKTLELDLGQVWLSDIELNIENDTIELPHRPIFRYSTPIFNQQGVPFGLIIINIDARPLLSELEGLALPSEILYATNSKGDFILHPQKNKRFGSDTGNPYSWEDEFTLSTLPFGFQSDLVTAWKGQHGDVIVSQSEFVSNINQNVGKTVFRVSTSLKEQYLTNLSVLATYFALLLLIGLLLAVFFYFNWANSRRLLIDTELSLQRRKDNMFKSLLELSPEALIICDSDGVIEIINSQTEKLFHYSRDEIVSKHINFLISNYDHVAPHIRVSSDEDEEILGIDKQGMTFPIEINVSPVQLEDRLLVASSVRDISERRKSESTLRVKSLEAERANQAKSAFLANMSHEIRTPLNAIIGLAYLLQEEHLDKKQRSLVEKVKLAGRSLLGIVNDVLDLAKIEANEAEINIAACNFRELLNELESVFSSQAEANGLLLKFEIDSAIPQWIMTDDKIVRQILTNLLGNALKFTQFGHILLTARLSKLGTSDYVIYIEVADTGIGISKEWQQKLFQPFSQVDEQSSRRYGGTGLGLSIVRSMADLLGGTVGVESQPEKGSQFWLTIPLSEPTEDEVDTLDVMSNALLVLIAEDDESQRLRLEQNSAAMGWQVISVASGTELVTEMTKRHHAGLQLPDVLMVDWQMPEVDGLEALSLVCDALGRKKLPAVLVISAYERDRIVQFDSEHLVDHILQKPVGLSELFNAVNDVVVKHTGNSERVLESTRTEAIKAKWLPNVKVLVVDDSEINLEVVCNILERNGADVTTANSGARAIEYLSDNPSSFDIVLMDIQMPEMDGLEATMILRGRLKLRDIPVVALTAGTLKEERKRALDSGMNDFLTKPLEPSKLIRTVRKLVELYRNCVISVQTHSKVEGIDNTDWPVIAGLERHEEMLNGDLPLLVSILQRLFTEHKNLEVTSDQDVKCLDNIDAMLTLAAQVHKLRGSAGLIGAQALHQVASRAETALRTNSDSVPEWLVKLGAELVALRESSSNFLAHYNKTSTDISEPSPTDNDVILSQNELEEYLQLLKNSDIDALNRFAEFTSGLRNMMSNNEFEQFTHDILNLDFDAALVTLNTRLKVEK